jgi:hypothetical protein
MERLLSRSEENHIRKALPRLFTFLALEPRAAATQLPSATQIKSYKKIIFFYVEVGKWKLGTAQTGMGCSASTLVDVVKPLTRFQKQ